MFRWLRRGGGSSGKAPPTRLSREEAVLIARRAAAAESLSESLSMVDLQDRSGGAVWVVRSATVGLVLEVSVDDASGGVLEIRHLGKR
jgi:hypothetical protein